MPTTQCVGQTRETYVSAGLSGLRIVVVSRKGRSGGVVVWEAAKETWLCGCESCVARARVKGSARRALSVGTIARASGTASAPF